MKRRAILKAAVAVVPTLAVYSEPHITVIGAFRRIQEDAGLFLLPCGVAEASALLSPVGQAFLPYPALPPALPALPLAGPPVATANVVCLDGRNSVLHVRAGGYDGNLRFEVVAPGSLHPFSVGSFTANQPSKQFRIRVSDQPSGVVPNEPSGSFTFPPGIQLTIRFVYGDGVRDGQPFSSPVSVTLQTC